MFIASCECFLRTVAKFLQERLPMNNVFLQNVRRLQPSQRVTAVGNQMITTLATCMSHLSTDINFADIVVTEWRLNQTDIDITACWFVSADGTSIPVDKYWSRVLKQVYTVDTPGSSDDTYTRPIIVPFFGYSCPTCFFSLCPIEWLEVVGRTVSHVINV